MRHSTFFLCKGLLLFLSFTFLLPAEKRAPAVSRIYIQALTGFDVLMESLIAEESPSVLKVFFISLSRAID